MFKKKGDNSSLPNLPGIESSTPSNDKHITPFPDPPSLPNHLHESEEFQSLPSFPDDSNKKGFSQTAIREAIVDHDKDIDAVESDDNEWSPQQLPNQPSFNETEIINPSPPPQTHKIFEEGKSGIFVKINKFHQARKNLRDAKDKITEIHDLLERIKLTRTKEEEELKSWESQINILNSRLKNISEEIFEDVEWYQSS
jgi:hypothetical protein